MEKAICAKVAVEGVAYHYDRLYSYALMQHCSAVPGCRVAVPFGRGNKTRQGVVMELAPAEDGRPLKPVAEVIDKEPLIAPDLLALAVWLRDQAFCTYFEACRLMFPAGIDARPKAVYRRNPEAPPEAFLMLTGDEKRAADLLLKKPLERRRLTDSLGLAPDSPLPDEMVRRGLLLRESLLEQGGHDATVRMVRLAISEDEAESRLAGGGLTKKQASVLKTVRAAGSASVKEICYFAGVTPAVITALVKKEILEYYEHKIYRNPYNNLVRSRQAPPELSPSQREAYERLLSRYEGRKASAALLLGVTGSGKTQVYMKLIERVRGDNKGVIVLVPEISLTPQTVSRFFSRFGEDVAVLHSGLSMGERLDEWQRIREGKANIVVGTRSAVFAPVRSLGLIIIDEEQEHTYKSESSPRYHAKDVARFRCARSGAQLVLASATPSIESRYAADTGRYALVRLDERYGGAELPEVITVDMKAELAAGNDGPLSRLLLDELQANISRGEQSILLLNRRGFNTHIFCAECGHVMTCRNCSIALTYHQANGRLMCHYCGRSEAWEGRCPACGGRFMRHIGYGTQKAEQALSEALPGAKILRMDTDTTMERYAHEKLLRKFEEEKYDILVGTQMVAKGLDFPNVTLVGVLSADQSLYMDDFRSAERTFSLLTQVVGRSGRGRRSGRAIIQTGTPENEVIRLSARQDYEAFYASEIELRRALLYPPFCDLYVIGFTGPSESEVKSLAEAFYSRLFRELKSLPGMPWRLMKPSPASVLKVSNRFRYRIILKCRNTKAMRAVVSKLLIEFGGNKLYNKSSIFADINPLSPF